MKKGVIDASRSYKKIAAIILALGFMTSLHAQSQVLGAQQEHDQWTGIYLSKDKRLVAKVTKKLVQQADLFNPAKYEYSLDLNDSKKPHLTAHYPLALDEAGLALVGDNAGECDDPGCTYFNSETNIILNSVKSLPEFELNLYVADNSCFDAVATAIISL